jgi:hypothetical protein
MPDAIATLADREHDRVIRCVMDHRHWVVLISGKPRVAAVESAANSADVVVEGHIFAIDAAGQLRRGNFYFGRFMVWHAGVCDRNSPEQRGFKVIWRWHRVHIARFVADFFGDAGIVGDDESEWTRYTASWRNHCN